jgi:hypothetical protein
MMASVGHSDGSLMASSFHLTDALQGFTREQGERIRAAVQMNSAAVMLEARDRSRTFRPNSAPAR